MGLTGLFSSLAPGGEAIRLACLARIASNFEGLSRALNPCAVTNQYIQSPTATHSPTLTKANTFDARTRFSFVLAGYFTGSILSAFRIFVFS